MHTLLLRSEVNLSNYNRHFPLAQHLSVFILSLYTNAYKYVLTWSLTYNKTLCDNIFYIIAILFCFDYTKPATCPIKF
jgi:hypothetical protein